MSDGALVLCKHQVRQGFRGVPEQLRWLSPEVLRLAVAAFGSRPVDVGSHLVQGLGHLRVLALVGGVRPCGVGWLAGGLGSDGARMRRVVPLCGVDSFEVGR